MIFEDKAKFLETIKMGYGNYNKKLPDETMLRMWWTQLQHFDINLVKASFDKWISTNRYIFTAADIVQLCRQGNEQHQHQVVNQNQSLLGVKKKDKAAKEEFSAKLAHAMQQAKLKQKRHPKAWAVKILERHDRGDYDSILGLEMAKEVVAELTNKEREELCLN